MHFLKNQHPSYLRAWQFLKLVLGLTLVFGMASLQAQVANAGNVQIQTMRFTRSDDGLFLSAQINFELPTAVEEALSKGVALVFVAEAELTRERWYWYDKKLASATRQFRLSYQPLTRKWRLSVSSGAMGSTSLGTGLPQYFDSLSDAMARIKRTTDWKIAEAAELEQDTTPTLELRFKLDVSQLPRPFQIGLIGNSDWTINAVKSMRISHDGGR